MRQVEIAWPEQGSGGYTVVHDTMGGNELVAFHFKTPAELGPNKGSINVVEYQGQACQRTGCLSLTAGAVDQPIHGQGTAFANDTAPTVTFYGSEAQAGKKHAVLLPNTDYYLNVQNVNAPDTGTFGTQVTLHKPKS